MKGFLKFVGTVAVSVALSACWTRWWLTSNQADIRVARFRVTSPKSCVSIDDCGVSIECEDGGLMQLRPGLVVDENDPLVVYTGGVKSGSFSLSDKTRRHDITIGIRDTLPFVELSHDGKTQPRNSLQADGF